MKIGKIVICKGSALAPSRFWDWEVCSPEEYTKDLVEQGWIKSNCSRYLNAEQLALLNS